MYVFKLRVCIVTKMHTLHKYNEFKMINKKLCGYFGYSLRQWNNCNRKCRRRHKRACRH